MPVVTPLYLAACFIVCLAVGLIRYKLLRITTGHPNKSASFDWRLFIAQGIGSGLAPFAPGTFGSVIGLAWLLLLLVPGRPEVYFLGIFLGIEISVRTAAYAEKRLSKKDPGSVVIDEIIALPICFLPVVVAFTLQHGQFPHAAAFLNSRGYLLFGITFLLFRLFDVTKPWPVGASQKLPHGWGITIDDMLAGVYVALCLVLVIWWKPSLLP